MGHPKYLVTWAECSRWNQTSSRLLFVAVHLCCAGYLVPGDVNSRRWAIASCRWPPELQDLEQSILNMWFRELLLVRAACNCHVQVTSTSFGSKESARTSCSREERPFRRLTWTDTQLSHKRSVSSPASSSPRGDLPSAGQGVPSSSALLYYISLS